MDLLKLATCTPPRIGPLPSWFVRPVPVRIESTLFPEHNPDEILAALRISPDEAREWYERKWLCFNPMKAEALEQDHIGALIYIRNIARSGAPEAIVSTWLKELPRDYAPDALRLAYSFAFGWVESAPPQDPHEVVDESITYWLEGLAENGDFDRLEEVKKEIESMLKRYRDDGSEMGETEA